jgi:hypothetical protein
MVVHTCNPVLWQPRQEDLTLEASLDFIVTLSQINKTKHLKYYLGLGSEFESYLFICLANCAELLTRAKS